MKDKYTDPFAEVTTCLQLRIDAQPGAAEEILQLLGSYIRALCSTECRKVGYTWLRLWADGAYAEFEEEDVGTSEPLCGAAHPLPQLAQKLMAAKQLRFDAAVTWYAQEFDTAQLGLGYWAQALAQRKNSAALRRAVRCRCIEFGDALPAVRSFVFDETRCGAQPLINDYGCVADVGGWFCPHFSFTAAGSPDAASAVWSVLLPRLQQADKEYGLDIPDEGMQNGVLQLRCIAEVSAAKWADLICWLYETAALLQAYGYQTDLLADFVPEYPNGIGDAFAVARLTLQGDAVCTAYARL